MNFPKTVIKRLLVIAATGLLSWILMMSWMPISWAAELSELPTAPVVTPNADQLFEIHCAGCHAQGGNIVRRGKTLKLKALQRNGMDSVEAITQIVAQGKGNMSAYQDRLTPEQIQTMGAYVLERANQGWKS